MVSRKLTKPVIHREEVLALDIATHCGYYSMHGNGTWNFTESKRRNDNKQHKDFRDTLFGFIREHGIRQVVAEDINVNNHFTDMRKLSEFRGILFEICDELDLPEPEFVNVATLKKWATGNGRADKAMMMRACEEKYHYVPPDDNAADACHLYYYYCRKYRL
jgi:Holliday junction resolvasome RuvABC endonuclease subunit